MDWANMVLHWEYPSNPATLLQRNWRLDRHLSDDVLPEFTVVYPRTGLQAELDRFEQLQKRSKLFGALFEQDHEPRAWPLAETGGQNSHEVTPWTRQYPPDPIMPYLHAASKAYCEAWRGPNLEQTWRTMLAVSEALAEMEPDHPTADVRFQSANNAVGVTDWPRVTRSPTSFELPAHRPFIRMKVIHLQGPSAVHFDLHGPFANAFSENRGRCVRASSSARQLFSIDPERTNNQSPAKTAHLEQDIS